MKTKLLLGAFFLFASLSLNAYELNGDLKVGWTGYKTEKKVGVSGTFKDVDLQITKNDDFVKFLKSAKVKIDTSSLDSGLEIRNKSMVSTLFSLKSSEKILASIANINENNGALTLMLTMNEVTKSIPMKYSVKDNKVVASGVIDILDYSMSESFAKFAKECFNLHKGKTFSEVTISFELPFKK
ncbi:MAG: YceI family protein [Campylobacteraceae bacterium]|nr:YceI family protein [Campylobacteraceae bacterium]